MEPGQREKRSDARWTLLAVMAIGAGTTFVAFFGPNWLASDSRRYGSEFANLGLWETCFRSLRGPEDDEYTKYFVGCRWIFREEYSTIRKFLLPAFFVAVQVFYTFGFILAMTSFVGLVAIDLCSVTNREARMMRLLALASFGAGVCCTIAVVIFGIRGDDRDWMPDAEHNLLSWSFALAVVGSFCHWISSVLFLIESNILERREYKQKKQRRNSWNQIEI